jgi:hypothetical protein
MVLSGEVTDEPAPLLPHGVGADDPRHQLVVVHGEATDSAVSILTVKKKFLLLLLRWSFQAKSQTNLPLFVLLG